MNIEDRLRDAFAQRTNAVEVSPGALFEVQRQLGRTRRVPELRLRPALVLAAAACAVTAVVVSVSLSTTTPDPAGEIVASPPVASPSGTASDTPPPTSTPTTPGPQPPAVSPTPPAVSPTPPAVPDTGTSQDGAGQIATVTPVTPPPAPQVGPPPLPPTPPTTEAVVASEQPETPSCAVEPAGSGESDEDPATWVTVYFACGEDVAAPRRRPAAAGDLTTALAVLMSGPNEADTAEGFRGLSRDPVRTASPTPEGRWVTIDLPSDLGGAFSAATADITAGQFLAQLNATVFGFPEFVAAEYRLNGDCAAFGDLLGRPCEVHTRDGGRHASELTAHTIGALESVIRAEPADGAASLGFLTDGARLTDRSAGSDAWAEVITTAGVQGWVSTEMLVAQPLALDGEATTTMVTLARRLTTGPGIASSAFVGGGLVLRWGADSDDVTLVSTAGAGVDSTWWDRALDVPSPRDDSTTASLDDLLWIRGASDSAVVTINAPGPLGEPHADFSSLAYVSIYQAAVSSSVLPPPLEAAAHPPTTTTTEATTSDGVELPPALPSLLEDEDGSADEEEPPEPLRAQISVIFDFLSPDGPRIAAVEAIWIEP